MHASGWLALIQRLPTETFDGLGVMMMSGLQINFQGLIRLDEQFLVVRGRCSGSTETDQIFFLPYDQIDCLMYYRPTKEAVVHEWFKDMPVVTAPGAEVEAGMEAGVEVASGLEPAPQPSPQTMPAPARPTTAGGRPVIAPGILPAKAAMIERLRKRGTGPGTGPKPPGQSSQGTIPQPPDKK